LRHLRLHYSSSSRTVTLSLHDALPILHWCDDPDPQRKLMPDALAPRLKLGVITPASNTIVQPEYDDMRPPGVTNQMARVLIPDRSEEHTSELQSRENLVCRLLLEKKKI